MSWLEKVGVYLLQHYETTVTITYFIVAILAWVGIWRFLHLVKVRHSQEISLGSLLAAIVMAPIVVGCIVFGILFYICSATMSNLSEFKTFPVLAYSEETQHRGALGRFVIYRDRGSQHKVFVVSKMIKTKTEIAKIKTNKAVIKKRVIKPQYRTLNLPNRFDQLPMSKSVQDQMFITKTKSPKPLKWTKANE